VRENRTHGSEGGEDGVLLYPYQPFVIPAPDQVEGRLQAGIHAI
jgi:hypothetical protein